MISVTIGNEVLYRDIYILQEIVKVPDSVL
jgi:hypothetical protein